MQQYSADEIMRKNMQKSPGTSDDLLEVFLFSYGDLQHILLSLASGHL